MKGRFQHRSWQPERVNGFVRTVLGAAARSSIASKFVRWRTDATGKAAYRRAAANADTGDGA
jgi:hypothetical protein